MATVRAFRRSCPAPQSRLSYRFSRPLRSSRFSRPSFASAASSAEASKASSDSSSSTMALAASEHQFVEKVLVNAEDIQARTAEMGKQLAAEFADAKPLVVCVLRGAAPFHTDLTRAMQPAPVGIEVDYIRASSYHGAATTTSGDVQLTTAGAADVKGRTVILVEDICDTGTTLRKLVDYCRAAGANSVTVVSLLNKQARRVVDLSDVDLRIAFEIPDEFVIGFGLDFDERFRTLPYVGVLRPGTDIN